MQQFFIDEKPICNDYYVFTAEQAHHASTVVRLDHEIVRLVYQGEGYFAEVMKDKDKLVAKILEKDTRINELDGEVVLAMALIRREKTELVLQKATELGVTKIVPFVSSRCVVKDDGKKFDRRQTILKEAAQQCKRNRIPQLCNTISFNELATLKADTKLAAYEKADTSTQKIWQADIGKSVVIVIGPEGGFSEEEVKKLESFGYQSVSLGSRILRAETAAIFSVGILASKLEAEE